ncbi:MAG TPA: hypothetical protein VFN61_04300 [Acidimicrobiales bacterium]|nr:hypothetical protein [Acidimicrobiales bacterium]
MALTVIALAATGCSNGPSASHPRRSSRQAASTSTPPVSTTTTTTTPPQTTNTVPKPVPTTQSSTTTTATSRPTTSTVAPSAFPKVIDQALQAMAPLPPGIEAPDVLPPIKSAVSAETTGLGGAYSVQLIATPTAQPVNSPAVGQAAANPSSDLGSFSTTGATSPAVAHAHLVASKSEDLAACSGAPSTAGLASIPGARACPTAQGDAITWGSAQWEYQVQEVGAGTVPVRAAQALGAWLSTHSLPAADSGIVSVSVPGTAEAGSSPSAVVVWQRGSDVYQVTSQTGYISALAIAASMRPWAAPGAPSPSTSGTTSPSTSTSTSTTRPISGTPAG